MQFLMLWLTLGLCLLMHFGIEDIVTFISLDISSSGDQPIPGPAYYAVCLTLIVLAWPMVLLEYVQKKS
ncbi:MAG: hypothetical protein ACYCW6_30060 [Candidatus Xenobia bacterium]